MNVQPDLFAANIQPLFEEHRAEFLETARAVARALAFERGEITIDDVREHCAPPPNVDPRVMGAVFRTDDFEAVGYRKSNRSTCHHRPVAVFRLAR